MTNFTELLAKKYSGHLDEKAEKYIHFIVDGAKRMQTLIQDLLSFSRVGKGEFKKVKTDLNLVVKQVLQDLDTTIKESKTKVEVEELPVVIVDEMQTARLFQNLLSNAIKYRSDQSPVVRIRTHRQSGEQVISVQDNGLGIDSEFFERIFVIFQRLHTKQEYEGTGVGLAVCKKIVERHGGKIWVESEEGKGSTFHFTLPS